MDVKLQTMVKPIRWTLVKLTTTESTQVEAGRLARAGAAEGTVVIASTQSAGRGRHGRDWVSPSGGLYASLILRPQETRRMQLLPLIASFAVADAIKDATGLSPRVRWPNDVMLGGKKVSGAIAEAEYSNRSLSYVVVGIGINCNSKRESLGPISDIATTLAEESGKPVDLDSMREAVLGCFEPLYRRWLGGRDLIRSRKRSISTLGKKVEIKTKTGIVPYFADDLRSDGALFVHGGGKKRVIRAEDVEWLRETPAF